ncbi:crossover junction endodeoxyribonuclease RuvC [Leucobacter chromiireducens]|uniref:Crossover junction endodeoxyribonuclease RuvC n=1 Tax=Leucobacter chromiireducens subsp. chromiireducens TaxID=660067 RepID=A0ABS1SRQ1_9MICO|nr:crossover junction endodeoxyribonuclease RuvC [Leucobacter chromiireducens]MBL3690625.1 crossover junction endodeoxyribonuclease RuvC [Leucobacter chromiireducens subsp. chromiireducens]
MRIIGIDPGLTRCGVGIVTAGTGRRVEFSHVEVLGSPAGASLPARLHQIGSGIRRLLDGERPDGIALERVFAQSNVASVMGVAQISGVVMYLAEERGIPVALYTPNEVKSQVTGYGAADKAQVTTMVTRLLGLAAPPKPADAADALALAITHAWHLGRGGAADRQGKGVAPAGETPAQRAWREAEAKLGRRRSGPRA